MKNRLIILLVLMVLLTSCGKKASEDKGTTPETNTSTAKLPENEEKKTPEDKAVEPKEEKKEEPKEEPKKEPNKEPNKEPQKEQELELVTVSKFFEQQPVVIYKSAMNVDLKDDEVPIGFHIIKDNLVSTYELKEEVINSIPDFAYYTHSGNREKYEEIGLLDMMGLYQLSDKEIVEYVENSKNYKAVLKDRPYVLGLVENSVYREERLYYSYLDSSTSPEKLRLKYIQLISEGDKELGWKGINSVEKTRELHTYKLKRNQELSYYRFSGFNAFTGGVRIKPNVRIVNDALGTEGILTNEDEIKANLGIK